MFSFEQTHWNTDQCHFQLQQDESDTNPTVYCLCGLVGEVNLAVVIARGLVRETGVAGFDPFRLFANVSLIRQNYQNWQGHGKVS